MSREDARSEERSPAEDAGETGVLLEVQLRNKEGGGRCSWPSLSSESSAAPYPPYLRQRRATRSAHSSTLTKRTAPACSMARGDLSLRIRTVGRAVCGMAVGWCVAMMSNEFERCFETSRVWSSAVEGAWHGAREREALIHG